MPLLWSLQALLNDVAPGIIVAAEVTRLKYPVFRADTRKKSEPPYVGCYFSNRLSVVSPANLI